MRKIIIIYPFLMIFFLFACTDSSKEKVKSEVKTEELSNEDQNTDQQFSEDISKQDLMTKLIGDHDLKSISGAVGANTMMDYYKEDGMWYATGSANSGGERDGFDIEISDEELAKLNSMKIIVKDDLSVILKCNQNEIFNIPFVEDGMVFNLTSIPEDYILMPEGISEITTFEGEILYIFAQDELSDEVISEIDIMQVYGDVVVISYNKYTSQFEMMLFYSECCDASTYYF